jgi:hypothetical protein
MDQWNDIQANCAFVHMCVESTKTDFGTGEFYENTPANAKSYCVTFLSLQNAAL